MKELKACVKTHKTSEVALVLHKVEGPIMGVSDVRVFGRSKAKDASPRIIENLVDYLLDRKIEVVCQNQIVEETVSMVDKTCHTCLRSDDTIYV